MDAPEGLEGQADGIAAWQIYTKHWNLLSSLDGIVMRVNDAAQELRDHICQTNNAEECLYNCIWALRVFLQQYPTAVDFGLDVFRMASAQLPETIKHKYGKGPEGAENILKWFLVEFSVFFQDVVAPYELGKTDSRDGSNVMFKRTEITDSREAVLKKLKDWQEAKLDIIVLLAIQGRCHSKGYSRLNRGEHVGDHAKILINNALERHHTGSPQWSKSDFVGCCILLRSCAKSLIASLPPDSRDATVTNWKDGFTKFLYSDDGGSNEDEDFAVKWHAAKALQNLENGPHDERSDELFSLRDWIL